MSRHMILSGIVNNLIGTVFTVLMIVLAFVVRKLWRKYGPRPRAAAKSVVRAKYTCPRCGETAVVSPTYEESAH